MKRYDPSRSVEPSQWLDLDEHERIALVESFHQRAGVTVPNPHLHAVFHAIVETQLATAEPEVVATLSRLRAEGLSRHDAIHAIGQVLATTMNEGASGALGPDLSVPYADRLRALTAAQWLNQEFD